VIDGAEWHVEEANAADTPLSAHFTSVVENIARVFEHVIDFCIDHKIIAFCLPAHISHRTQVLYAAVYSPLASRYKRLVDETKRAISKARFPKLLHQARKKACTRKNPQSGWKKIGLYPFRPWKLLERCRLPDGVEPPLPRDEMASAKYTCKYGTTDKLVAKNYTGAQKSTPA
jgi:hypothetical protein